MESIIIFCLILVIAIVLTDLIITDYVIISCLTYILYNLTKYIFNPSDPTAYYGGADKKLKVYAYAHVYSSGLIIDGEIIHKATDAIVVYENKQLVKNADILIHIEKISPGLTAKYHIWIPNQEVISEWDNNNKNKIDLVLCKTHKTVEVIKNLYKNSKMPIPKIIYTSFSSVCNKKFEYTPRKKFDDKLVLLPGSSIMKNIDLIIDIWLANDCFKKTCKKSKLYITYGHLFVHDNNQYAKINKIIHDIIKNRCGDSVYKSFASDLKTKNKITIKNTNITIFNKLPTDEYQQLVNKAGIVLCCSMTEGFGHYISESKYYGNVILTTDAAPMNELITLPELRVKAVSRGFIKDYDVRSYMMPAPVYGVDPDDFAKKFISVYNLKNKTPIRKALHESYVKNDSLAISNFKSALKNINLHDNTTI